MNSLSTAIEVDGFLHDLLRASGLSVTHRIASTLPESMDSIVVEFEGPDSELLIAHDGELLLAMEHIAARSMRLEPGENHRLSFDAGGWKADRDKKLVQSAAHALTHVRATGQAYEFPPMSSHERRLLHVALAPSGLSTASEGEGPARHLVLLPVV